MAGAAAFAALLTAAAAAAPLDGAVARVSAATGVLSALESGACPPGAVPETAVADAAEGRLTPEGARAVDAAREDLRLYFACRAYAAGGPGPCAALSRTPARVAYSVDKSALKRPDTLDFLCASDLYDMRMARAAIAGERTAFVAACRGHDELGHRDFKRGKVEEACGLLAGGASDPAATCARLAPLFSNPAPEEFCRGELAQFAGDAVHCASIAGQPASRELCEGYAAWRASRDGGKGACASSPVCRVLSGEGEAACAPLGARAMTGACAAFYAPKALDAAAADLDAADAALAAAAEGTPSRADAARADAAAEDSARARLRLAALRRAARSGEAAR